jgi:hypothetical protein
VELYKQGVAPYLVVTGGKADTPSGVTDAKGEFDAAINWDEGAATKAVTVTSGQLTTVATLPTGN